MENSDLTGALGQRIPTPESPPPPPEEWEENWFREESPTEITPPAPIEVDDPIICRPHLGHSAEFSLDDLADPEGVVQAARDRVEARKKEALQKLSAYYEACGLETDYPLADRLEPEGIAAVTRTQFCFLLLIVITVGLALGVLAGAAHLWWPLLAELLEKPGVMLVGMMLISLSLFVGAGIIIRREEKRRRNR